jgi:hypothetical protein
LINFQYLLDLIYRAAKDRKEVLLVYRKKDKSLVRRQVRPYEVRDGWLWASCGTHHYSIHKFWIKRIQRAYATNTKYSPQWTIKITKKKKIYPNQ